jgi:RNA polymerase sigma-70 factor (ECF subfamily)
MKAADATGDSTDQQLIVRRDRTAFEEFYRAYARRVIAFAADIVGSTEISEEVAGDTMVAVWQSAHRFRGRSRVVTWVLGIAHHKAIDALRRRPPDHVLLTSLPDFPASEPGPHEELLRWEERFTLDLALRSLSLEHRTVLQLMYGFGCSQAEIAEITGCPIATVKTRVHYAKRRLRAARAPSAATGEPA